VNRRGARVMLGEHVANEGEKIFLGWLQVTRPPVTARSRHGGREFYF